MAVTIFTCGDVNGIGPEIVIKTINQNPPSLKNQIIFICPKNVFKHTIAAHKPKFSFEIVKRFQGQTSINKVTVLDLGVCSQSIGKPTKLSGKMSYRSIEKACELLKIGVAESVVTAPISKDAIAKAGIEFPGHTEIFASHFKVKNYAMMFVSKKMKAGLITIHIPINKIEGLLTEKLLESTLDVIYNSLKLDFKIINPSIAVLGLNPHAGENGKIGLEEKEIILPTISGYKHKVFGPFVPDAYFGNLLYKNYDLTLGMYHDQVLIPFKLLNFNMGVNFTAGLPIVRTSPDHGTAFDIAGKGIANPNSMIQAFQYAKNIVKNRRASFGKS